MREIKDLALFHLAGLWARRWSIAAVAWVVCLGGWLFVALMPPQYTARATIYVDTQSILGPLMRGLTVDSDVERQLMIMRQTLLSRPNMEQLIRDAGLDLELDVGSSPVDQTNLIESLQRNIRISARNNTLFEVSYTHKDPELAYRVVDTVLQIFVEQNIGDSQRDVETARGFIGQQIEDYEQRLREADLAVAEFRRENADKLGNLERLRRQLGTAQSELAQLRTELDSAIWQRDQLQLQLSSTPPTVPADELRGGPSPAEQRLMELQGRLDELMRVYTERHPDVVALRGMIRDARAELAARREEGEGGGPRRPNPVHEQLRSDLQVAERRIAELRRRISEKETQIEELSVQVQENPTVEAELRRLTRDYEIILDQYQALVERRETAQLAERMRNQTNNVEFRLVEPPMVPSQPSGPNYSLMMLAVVVAAFGSGGGLAFLRVQLDPSVTSAHQLREQFDLPVLGALSMVPSVRARRWHWVERGLFAGVVCVPVVVGAALFAVYGRPVPPDIRVIAADFVATPSARLGQLF
jgi:polysaccharide chain length determinant protein (PEP-CTERM system associated)